MTCESREPGHPGRKDKEVKNMQVAVVRIDSKFRVIIPKRIRVSAGIDEKTNFFIYASCWIANPISQVMLAAEAPKKCKSGSSI